MKQSVRIKILAIMCAVFGFIGNVSATHIDELGINITVFSSDGAGNFTLQYDEYFGADSTTIWDGTQWGEPFFTTGACTSAADCFYNTGISISIDSGPGSLVGSTSVALTFQGLVDSSGTPLSGFGTSQFFENGNGTTDASIWSGLMNFSISGFDPNETYVISGSSTDCCFVTGGGGPTFDGTFQFDPTVVVESPVPEPATLSLMSLGLLGFCLGRRKTRNT